MKKETCPFCGHRMIIMGDEEHVICPSCKNELPREWLDRPRML